MCIYLHLPASDMPPPAYFACLHLHPRSPPELTVAVNCHRSITITESEEEGKCMRGIILHPGLLFEPRLINEVGDMSPTCAA